jgi:hypothetical protein
VRPCTLTKHVGHVRRRSLSRCVATQLPQKTWPQG